MQVHSLLSTLVRKCVSFKPFFFPGENWKVAGLKYASIINFNSEKVSFQYPKASPNSVYHTCQYLIRLFLAAKSWICSFYKTLIFNKTFPFMANYSFNATIRLMLPISGWQSKLIIIITLIIHKQLTSSTIDWTIKNLNKNDTYKLYVYTRLEC